MRIVVRAEATIYINSDGTINPVSAPISSVDNVTYTFIDNINDQIIVRRSNIIVDGNGFTLQGFYTGSGISLAAMSNVAVRNLSIRSFAYGVNLTGSTGISIAYNNFTDNINSIHLWSSTSNTIEHNSITTALGRGIVLERYSDNNIISANTIINTYRGLYIGESQANALAGNVINNCRYSMHIYGSQPQHFIQTIDTSNLKEGNPIYYLVNQKNMNIDPESHPQVGYLALVSCDNIAVERLAIAGNGEGLLLANTTNSRISNMTIADNYYGVRFLWSSGNTLSDSSILDCYDDGVELKQYSKSNRIERNRIANSSFGASRYALMVEEYSEYNVIRANTVENNKNGIFIGYAQTTFVYHNNFINNTAHAIVTPPTNATLWSNGFEGNYWSNYTGTDLHSGSSQNETGSDGIGDTPHQIAANNRDDYPLLGKFSEFQDVGQDRVQVISNSTVSDFAYNGTAVSFKVTGEDGTVGFCRVNVPKALLGDTQRVFVNDTEIMHTHLSWPQDTYSRLYFSYDQSTKEVTIVPEISSTATLFCALVALIAALIHKNHFHAPAVR